MSFKREDRYVVLKVKDIEKHLHPRELTALQTICSTIEKGRQQDGKRDLQCVVVESDWRIYDEVWDMVEFEHLMDTVRPMSMYFWQQHGYSGEEAHERWADTLEAFMTKEAA